MALIMWLIMHRSCLLSYTDHVPLETIIKELSRHEYRHVCIGKKHTLNIYRSQYLYYQRSLLGYSPWDHKESDTTEWLNTLYRLKIPWHFNKAPLSFSHAKKIVLLYNASISQLSMAIMLILIIFIKKSVFNVLGHFNAVCWAKCAKYIPLLPIYLGYCFG